jgi:hypothetical protein
MVSGSSSGVSCAARLFLGLQPAIDIGFGFFFGFFFLFVCVYVCVCARVCVCVRALIEAKCSFCAHFLSI